jgi:predicted phage terminase large subunit-like protein
MVKIVQGPWVAPFLDELDGFPEGAHDDQVDALAGAWNYLMDKSAAPAEGPDIWR